MTATVLVCLHGWGGSKESFTELREALRGTDIEILTPDLPGFGDEPEPDRPWTVEDYADWVEKWLKKKNQESRIMNQGILLLGHSRGGRFAIRIVERGNIPIQHLFLCAAAGIRHPQQVRKALGFLLAKSGKLFLAVPGMRHLQPFAKRILYKLFRVRDYEVASPIMRQTLINVLHNDVRPIVPTITIPTDIFWGTEDTQTPLRDGETMHRLIAGSRLHVFPGVRHRVHRDRAKEIAAVIREAMKNRA